MTRRRRVGATRGGSGLGPPGGGGAGRTPGLSWVRATRGGAERLATRPTTEAGMVTVETAFAVILLALIGGVALAMAGAVFVLGACQVTANEVARQEARGDQAAVARARQDAPRGATVLTRRESGAVVTDVTVTARVGPVVWPIRAQATVVEERP